MTIEPERVRALEAFLAGAAAADRVHIKRLDRLGGGAIQQNHLCRIEVAGGPWSGAHRWVIRSAAPSGVAESRPCEQEYALLRAAHGAGVTVPEPLFLCADPAVLGRPFFVMRAIEGTGLGPRIVRDGSIGGERTALARRLGEELARIHAIGPRREGLAFLGAPPDDPARDLVERYRGYLDELGRPYPALEWGLRWLELNAPVGSETVLCHRDFRTGNYLVNERGLTGILDWEFAGWGDPLEDVAWFCAKPWRFGVRELEAGGIAKREPFYHGYATVSGRPVDPAAVRYWEVLANVRWGVIALLQGRRHTSGREPSLELALIGRRVGEMELETLLLIEAAEREGGD
ncbi:MAG TPA: phosphotransferase family protein [Geminicoccaceae bacterium]|nr:phosphotransferase family protein [Geminicoccaceae bacterium]